MLSEVFWVAFISTICGLILKLASLSFKSKCREIDLCCLKIKRDVELEEKETEFRILNSNRKEEEEKTSQ